MNDDLEMPDEIDFDNAPCGTMYRKHRERALRQVLDADVAAAFPTTVDLNNGLRILIQLDAAGKLNLKESLKEGIR